MDFCLADRSSLFNTRLVPWHCYNEMPQHRKAGVGHVDSCWSPLNLFHASSLWCIAHSQVFLDLETITLLCLHMHGAFPYTCVCFWIWSPCWLGCQLRGFRANFISFPAVVRKCPGQKQIGGGWESHFSSQPQVPFHLCREVRAPAALDKLVTSHPEWSSKEHWKHACTCSAHFLVLLYSHFEADSCHIN